MTFPSDRLTARLESPLILIGMGRSGTSITTELLAACGLFAGRNQGRHAEAAFFQRLNRAVLRAAGASWEEPEPYLAARRDPWFVERTTQELADAVRRGFGSGFLTLSRRWSLRLGRPFAWGWKDPRTCLLLPQWLRIFPGAGVLHVIRHPQSVAGSLSRRERLHRQQGKPVTDALLEMERPLQLWELYVRECLAFRDLGPRYHELRYEDLLADPPGRLAELCRFAGLTPTPEQLERAAGMVRVGGSERTNGRKDEGTRQSAASVPTPLRPLLHSSTPFQVLRIALELGYTAESPA